MRENSDWFKEKTRIDKEFVSSWEKFVASIHEEELTSELRKMGKLESESLSHTAKRLRSLKKSVTNFKSNLRDLIHNGSDIQKILEDIEDNLSAYKRQMRSEFDRLNTEQTNLSGELESEIYNRLDEYDQVISIGTGSKRNQQVSTNSAINVTEEAEKEIAYRSTLGSIERQFAVLGRFGGWESRDHDVFLRIWTQLGMKIPAGAIDDDVVQLNQLAEECMRVMTANQQVNIFVRKLAKQLPITTEMEIVDHIEWYIKYSYLVSMRKNLLHEWKQGKKSEKSEMADLQSQLENELRSPRHGHSNISENNNSDPFYMEEQRKLVKERVDTWKKLKQEEQEQKRVLEKLQQEAEHRKKDEERRQRQQETRLQVGKWKETESLNRAQRGVPLEVKTTRPASADPAEIQRRRLRDLEIGKQRHLKAEQRQQELNIRSTKIKLLEEKFSAKVYAEVARDPSRIHGATKASEAQRLTREHLDDVTSRRLSAGAHSKPIAMTGRDLRVGVRATPAWCKPML